MPDGRIAHAIAIAAVCGDGQDRARVFESGDHVTVALADGAGGTGHGAAAAQAIVDAVGGAHAAVGDWSALLLSRDRDAQQSGRGQSTAVIISICSGVVSGASVGDSGAWLIHKTDAIDLTEGQSRKPLVGAGCTPWRIPSRPLGDGTLLIASDGLFRYAKRAAVLRLASDEDLPAAARALIDLVRLPNGALQDDVAVVLCRMASRT